MIRVAGQYVYEHRYVVELALGRPLKDHESVHHRNGDRSDNRLENLELWVRHHPYGQRAVDFCEWLVREYTDRVRGALERRHAFPEAQQQRIFLDGVAKGRGCSVDGCTRVHLARGFCHFHYYRWKRTGNPEPELPERFATCSINGCLRKHYGRGFCRMHWDRVRRTGRPGSAQPLRETNDRYCSVAECLDQHFAKGFCKRHYHLWRKNGPPNETGRRLCSVDGCGRLEISRTFCNLHYKRFRKDGEPGLPAPVRQRFGQGTVTPDGYRRVMQGGRYKGEHRVVMEQALGRTLKPYEHIHHRNGDRLDNRLENLELWISGHPVGRRLDDLLSWAVVEYRDFLLGALDKDLNRTEHSNPSSGH